MNAGEVILQDYPKLLPEVPDLRRKLDRGLDGGT